MIGKDDSNNEEQQVLKVNDRRKFNIDGSLREGVTLDFFSCRGAKSQRKPKRFFNIEQFKAILKKLCVFAPLR